MSLGSAIGSPIGRAIGSALAGGGGEIAFDPASLFGASDHGAIIDLTDASLLFQSNAGTGAVSADNDPIGYATDLGPDNKPVLQATAANKPLWSGVPRTLGSELVTNGGFATDTDWTKGTGWTIGSGVATKAAGTASVLSQAISLTAGKTYFVTYQITRSAGTVTARFTGGTTVSGTARSLSGSYIELLVAVTGNTTLEFSADATFAGTVDNVTVKEVTGYVNRGAWFDGTNDRLQSAAIDLSGSDKATIVWSCYYDAPAGGYRTPFEFGNYWSSLTGSVTANYGSAPSARIRGNAAHATSSLPNSEGKAGVPVLHVNSAEIDFADTTILEEIILRGRGVLPTNTASGTTSGTGPLANSAFTVGAAANELFYWHGLIHRLFIINRTLTDDEREQVTDWARSGMAYCAVLGDSTVAITNAAVGLTNCVSVSSLCGGMVCGAADVSLAGDRIADQKTDWTALPSKTALEAVFIQVGLNDIMGRVGAGTATTAQVIADLQDLVDTVNADKPAGCKTYICGLTPCKAWLDLAANPADAYQAWLDVNAAIAGTHSTNITGVDARITSHVAALNDGSGNLAAEYAMDGVHENNAARFIIAQAWRTQLEADGLVST